MCRCSNPDQLLYNGLQLTNIVDCPAIHNFITGLIKCGSAKQMKRSKVQKCHDLFLSWPANNEFTTKGLRIKAITVLSFMLRPLNVAPESAVMTEIGHTSLLFTVDHCF